MCLKAFHINVPGYASLVHLFVKSFIVYSTNMQFFTTIYQEMLVRSFLFENPLIKTYKHEAINLNVSREGSLGHFL